MERKEDGAAGRVHGDVRRVLDAARDGMGLVRDGRWLHVNPALARQLGSTGALEGEDLQPWVAAADWENFATRIRSVRAALAPAPGVVRFVRPDHSTVGLEVSLTPMEGPDDTQTVMLVTRDLTERRRRFSRMVAADRGAALGALAASISHGINTPLAQVHGGASYARDQARRLLASLDTYWEHGDLPSVRDGVRTIVEHTGQMLEGITAVANISRSLGLFTQRDGEDHTTEPGRVIDAAIDLTENVIRHRAKLTCEVAMLPAIRGSEAAVGHLLLSALLASAQSIPEGDAAHHEVRVRAAPVGDGVHVEITDTGAPRLPEGVLDESDPMAALERGASPAVLALSLCRALAIEVGGSFDVAALRRGTRVTIRFAGADRPSDATLAARRRAASQPVTRGRVLVVDDEPVLLGLIVKLLQLDHDVEGTVDPAEALARIERGERYDVILCDLMMPTMSGVELHTRITRFAPHVAKRMIFLTAGAFTATARAFLETGEVAWYEKPIEPDQLREIIAARVAASRAV